MNPHRCKILCDKPFESSLCHRNDTTEHIATRRKAILPRRKVIRAMPSEPFVSTASYAVCPHPLRYGPALSSPPRVFQLFSSPARRGANRSCHRCPYKPALPGRSAPSPNTGPNTVHPARTGKDDRPPNPIAPNTNITPSQMPSQTRNITPDMKKPARKVRDPPDRRVRPGKNLYLSIPVIMKRPAPRAARGRPVVAHPDNQ